MFDVEDVDMGAEVKVRTKPDISRLPDAFELDIEGRPQPRFRVGDEIVIERHSIILSSKPWLNTETYVVQDIDHITGNMRLWHQGLQQFDLTNYVTGFLKHGFVYKLAKGNEIIRKKRGRPRKTPIEDKTSAVVPPPSGAEGRKRGRPKGSKNKAK